MTYAVKRAGRHVGRLSLIVLIVLLVVAGIGGIDTVSGRMLATGANRLLDSAEPQARSALLSADAGPDLAAQDAEMRAHLAAAFAGAHTVVSRASTVDLTLGAGPKRQPADDLSAIRLLDDPRIADLADLTGGSWPQKQGQIALPDAAVQRLHVGIGEDVPLADGTALTLVGTWTAKNPAATAWHGDPAVASGEDDGTVGPAVVATGALAERGDDATVIWEIRPVDLRIADIPVLQHAMTTLRGLPLQIDPHNQHGTRVLGTLEDTLHRQAAAVTATRGLLVAPLLVIALLGALVLGVVLSTLTAARSEEIALLRARGASVRRLTLTAMAEIALLAAAGAGLALLLLAIFVGVSTPALLTAAAAVVFSVLVAALSTLRSAGGADVVGPDAQRSDASRSLTLLLVPAGIAVGLAALSGWQLFSTGSVLRADGSPEPLASVAPALLLIAACALAPVLAAPLAALAERLLRRTRGIAPILPVRQIARRMSATAIAIVCLALAAASVAFAATAPVSADAAEQRTRDALLGADVRMISDGALDVTADVAATWAGVTRASEVLRAPLTVGSEKAVFLAGVPGVADTPHAARPVAGDSIPATVTRSLVDRLGAKVGTVFTAQIRFVVHPVSIRVSKIVDTLPGVGDGWGVAVATGELSIVEVQLTANELWLDSRDPAATASRLRAQVTHPVRILTAPQVSAAPVTSVAPSVLTAGALLAAVLGAIGFLAASTTASGARRDEGRVLLALGLRHSRERALRTGETMLVGVYAVLAGGALGAVVASSVLPIVLGTGA